MRATSHTFDALLQLAQASFDAQGVRVTPEVLQATAKSLNRLALPVEEGAPQVADAQDFQAMLQRCAHA
jgi:metal-dependent HD superfamily phosphatase/phosphodiesterase